MSQDLSSLKEKLTQAGFRPAPFSGILHAIRKLVWPIIRQYHFFELESLVAVSADTQAAIDRAEHRFDLIEAKYEALRAVTETDEALSRERQRIDAALDRYAALTREAEMHRNRLDEQSASLTAQIGALQQRVTECLEETRKIVPVLVTLRSDCAALTNRQLVFADDFYSQKEGAAGQLRELAAEVASLSNRQGQETIQPALATLAAFQIEIAQTNTALEAHRAEFGARIGALATQTAGEIERAGAQQLRFADEITAKLESAREDWNQERTQLHVALEAQRAESAARFDALLPRMSAMAQDALFHASLPAAEARAEIVVLRTRVDRSAAVSAEIEARLAALDRRGAMIDELSARQAEQATNYRELEWRSRFYLHETNGGLFVLKRGEVISDFAASGEIWDRHVLEVAREAAQLKRGTAVDVGAHFGLTSAAMARLFDRVVSFEPNDFTYSFLQANMALNRFTNVQCHHAALYSHECDVSLGRPEQQEIALPLRPDGVFDGKVASNLGALLFTESGTGIFRQKTRTLDSYELENVTFVKIDAQGADNDILFGSVDTLRRCHPIVVFEREEFLSRNFSRTFEEACTLLKELGYSVSLLQKTNEKQSDYIARYRP